MRKLTTHILDTARGCPAAGVDVRVFAVSSDGERTLLKSAATDADGRAPLLVGDEFPPGLYELNFNIGAYFAAEFASTPPFLNVVAVHFTAAAEGHYHIPLLASPYGCSTYRGS